jgi:predicted nucleotidyltransferase
MKVIFNGVYGSRLYGLETPTSDWDYKGIYLPTKRDIVFNTYKESIEQHTNTLDTTLYAATKFVKILSKCDTVSFDMIHTPEQFTLETSLLWESMQEVRSDFYCKNMRGILGYIRTQASKYGHKVDRLKAMEEVLHQLVRGVPLSKVHNNKYVKLVPERNDVKETLDVCGSRYQTAMPRDLVIDSLNARINRYGERTKKGSLAGGDWKAMSHAFRVLLQLEEIVETRDLVFPLVRADEILKMKLGEHSQADCVAIIDEAYDRVVAKLEASDLPEHARPGRLEELIYNEYC